MSFKCICLQGKPKLKLNIILCDSTQNCKLELLVVCRIGLHCVVCNVILAFQYMKYSYVH